jgi:hypothetical protein
MIYSKLKKKAELIIKNCSEEFRVQNRKKLLEEFFCPDDYNILDPIITKENKKDHILYKYKTKILFNKQELKIDFVVKEYPDNSLIAYTIDDSYIKTKKIDRKTVINIFGIVAIYFLQYMITVNDDRLILFQTNDDSMSKIDHMLLKLYKMTFPNFKYKEREFKDE